METGTIFSRTKAFLTPTATTMTLLLAISKLSTSSPTSKKLKPSNVRNKRTNVLKKQSIASRRRLKSVWPRNARRPRSVKKIKPRSRPRSKLSRLKRTRLKLRPT